MKLLLDEMYADKLAQALRVRASKRYRS